MRRRRRKPEPTVERLMDATHATYAKLIGAVRAQEKIVAVAPILVATGDVLAGILEIEPELAPEIREATRLLEELAETFNRMQVYVEAKVQADVDRTIEEL